LGITLTKRSNGKAGNVPLAGFPHHAIDTYLPKLVKAGYRVAVCEQVENPKFAKGIVKRDVVEVVTPGVAFSDKLLDHTKNNYLASIYINKETAGISFTDVSTGEYFCYQIPVDDIQNQLGLITPSEILIPKNQKHFLEPIIGKFSSSIRITKIDEWVFNYEYAADLLLTHFNTKTLKGFGIENLEQGIIAAGAILNYLKDTQKANLSHIMKLSKYNSSDFMLLDPATKRNLEITFTIQDGTWEGTLISILDKTNTPMGS